MSPIVRTIYFAGVSFLTIIVLLCTAWLATTVYLFVAYGLLESLTFTLGSASIIVIIYGMKRHDYHKYDHGCDRR